MILILIRTSIIYIFVTVAIRLMGKRQIGDMQPNELVITLLISEIAAIPLQDAAQPVINGIVAIFMLVVLEITVSVISMKNIYFRRIMNGQSVIVIKDGTIDQKAMRKLRLTVIELTELLHGKDVFDIGEVAYAILEINGEISVIKKSDFQSPKNSDINIKPDKATMSIPVISDGTLLKSAVKDLGLTEKDIINKLNGKKIKDVFLMTMDSGKKASVVYKEDK